MNRDTKDFNDDSLMGEKSHFQSEIDWLNEEINHLEKENNQMVMAGYTHCSRRSR